MRNERRIDFSSINREALGRCPALLFDLLPGGKIVGAEYVARNPRREDRRAGSFSVNVQSGRWADFATGDRGGDLVSLCAYLRGLSQGEAARALLRELGMVFYA